MKYEIIGQDSVPDAMGNLPYALLRECSTLSDADVWAKGYTKFGNLGGWDSVLVLSPNGKTKIEISEFGTQYY